MQHQGWDGGGPCSRAPSLPGLSRLVTPTGWGNGEGSSHPTAPKPYQCHHADRGSPSFEVGPQSTLTRQARAHGGCLLCPTPLVHGSAPFGDSQSVLTLQPHGQASRCHLSPGSWLLARWPSPTPCQHLVCVPGPLQAARRARGGPRGAALLPGVSGPTPRRDAYLPLRPARHSYTTRLLRSPGYGLAGVSRCGFSRVPLFYELLRLPPRVLFVEACWPF